MIFLQVRPITTFDDASTLLQMAVELEFSTLPPYLYALYSIKPGTNAEASSRIRFVVMEEMVHMCLACNIMNALGRNPALTAPKYPGPLPGGISGDGPNALTIHLYPFSKQAMQQAMSIEEPEDGPIDIPHEMLAPVTPSFMTIGQFYNHIDNFLKTLPDSSWTAGRNQIDARQFLQGGIFPVNNYADAHNAIQRIVSEGEGNKKTPLDFEGQVSHYYRFGEVFYDQVLTKQCGRICLERQARRRLEWRVSGNHGSGQPLFWQRSARGARRAGPLRRSLHPSGDGTAARGCGRGRASRQCGARDVRPADGCPTRDDGAAGGVNAGGRTKLHLPPGSPTGECTMSVLDTPRLYFRGKATWDPIVTNNLPAQYSEDHSKTVFGTGAADVAPFRKDAIAAVTAVTQANWNPAGTHRSVFYETTIVGVDVGDGVTRDDPIVNCPVNFAGMLVDLDPYGASTSQLFFDAMSFGIQGGCRVFAPRRSRMTARYINFSRNTVYGGKNTPAAPAGGASVVWQTSFAKGNGGLVLDPYHSAVVEHFAKNLQDDDVLGLTVRWNAYFTRYYDTSDVSRIPALAQQLQNNLSGGGFQPNPARSEVVGVLGLWLKGEPASEPGDRALLTRNSDIVASAHARLSAKSLTLDLANSIPETDLNLTKQNLGNLTAVAVAPDGHTVVAELGTFDYTKYNRDAYNAKAGIVTLTVDPTAAQKAQSADLQLRKSDGTVLLAETALRAIATTPNRYLDEDETATLAVQVLDRGRPAGSGINVAMADITGSAGAATTQPTNAQGVATFPLSGNAGKVEGYALLPGNAGLTQFDEQLNTYVYVRTRPADASIGNKQPTWDNVHKYVLRNWHAMAPCMDNWLDLGNPDQVKAFGPMLRQLTDKANFESFRFMPVTRDMTAGERKLLYAFLGPPVTIAAADAPVHQPSALELSRALRGG
jgi:Ferritin-like